MSEHIVFGKLPNETEAEAAARIKAALAEHEAAIAKKAALLKKLGMG